MVSLKNDITQSIIRQNQAFCLVLTRATPISQAMGTQTSPSPRHTRRKHHYDDLVSQKETNKRNAKT